MVQTKAPLIMCMFVYYNSEGECFSSLLFPWSITVYFDLVVGKQPCLLQWLCFTLYSHPSPYWNKLAECSGSMTYPTGLMCISLQAIASASLLVCPRPVCRLIFLPCQWHTLLSLCCFTPIRKPWADPACLPIISKLFCTILIPHKSKHTPIIHHVPHGSRVKQGPSLRRPSMFIFGTFSNLLSFLWL